MPTTAAGLLFRLSWFRPLSRPPSLLQRRAVYWSVALCCAGHPSSIGIESLAVIFTCAQWW